MNELRAFREHEIEPEMRGDFNHMRQVFADICDEYSRRKLTSSLKSSTEYRVKFQSDSIKRNKEDDGGRTSYKRPNISANKLLESYSHEDKSSRYVNVVESSLKILFNRLLLCLK